MSNIPIRDITETGTPAADSYIVFDDGSMKKGLVSDLADGVRPVATQSEAQTGSDNTKTMTPLRVKQSISSEVGVSLASKSQGDTANTALQPDDIGDSVQAYSSNLDDFSDKTAPTGDVVGTLDTQTLTNKTLTAPAITSPTGIVKGDVGLGNVDNTSDADKPVSTAAQTSLDAKANTSDLATVATSGAYSDLTGAPTLGSLAAKSTVASADLASDVFSTAHSWSGIQTFTDPVVGTQTTGDNSTKAASTAFVQASISESGGGDMLKADNLAGLTDIDAARANLSVPVVNVSLIAGDLNSITEAGGYYADSTTSNTPNSSSYWWVEHRSFSVNPAFAFQIATSLNFTPTQRWIRQDSSGTWSAWHQLPVGIASQADQETGTSTSAAVTPAVQQFHPSAAKVWCQWGVTSTIDASYNVSSITDNGTGNWTVNYSTAFSDVNYARNYSVQITSATAANPSIGNIALSAASCAIICNSSSVALVDPTKNFFSAFGDQ